MRIAALSGLADIAPQLCDFPLLAQGCPLLSSLRGQLLGGEPTSEIGSAKAAFEPWPTSLCGAIVAQGQRHFAITR